MRKDKPPVLTDEQIADLLDLEKECDYQGHNGITTTIDIHAVLNAQRDADVRFYEKH